MGERLVGLYWKITELFHKTKNRKHNWASERMGTGSSSLPLPVLLTYRPSLFYLLIKPNIAASNLNSYNFPIPESLGSLSPHYKILREWPLSGGCSSHAWTKMQRQESWDFISHQLPVGVINEDKRNYDRPGQGRQTDPTLCHEGLVICKVGPFPGPLRLIREKAPLWNMWVENHGSPWKTSAILSCQWRMEREQW